MIILQLHSSFAVFKSAIELHQNLLCSFVLGLILSSSTPFKFVSSSPNLYSPISNFEPHTNFNTRVSSLLQHGLLWKVSRRRWLRRTQYPPSHQHNLTYGCHCSFLGHAGQDLHCLKILLLRCLRARCQNNHQWYVPTFAPSKSSGKTLLTLSQAS